MSKLYCIYNTEEYWVESPGHKTKKEAIEWYEKTTGEKFNDEYQDVRVLTQAELDALPEV